MERLIHSARGMLLTYWTVKNKRVLDHEDDSFLGCDAIWYTEIYQLFVGTFSLYVFLDVASVYS